MSQSDIDWGFYGYGANGTIKAVSQGAAATTVGPMAAGDTLRLMYDESKVLFYLNDVPVLVATYPAPATVPYFPAQLDTSFYTLNSGLKDVQLCSNTSPPAGPDVWPDVGPDVPQIIIGRRSHSYGRSASATWTRVTISTRRCSISAAEAWSRDMPTRPFPLVRAGSSGHTQQ